MKIAICIPCHGDPKHQFLMSLLAMQKTALLDGEHEIEIISLRGALIDHAREQLAYNALKGGADYLLWLDADMAFPADTLARLISHNLPVVAANYRKRKVRATISSAHILDGDAYKPIEPKGDGMEEVDMVGLGVCLMKAEVFHELPRRWFIGLDVGEDSFFFERLKEAKGIRPFVDHRLSAEVGHVAEAILMF